MKNTKSLREDSLHSNREKEERGGDFYETFGGEAKRNSVLILGEEKLLKRDF